MKSRKYSSYPEFPLSTCPLCCWASYLTFSVLFYKMRAFIIMPTSKNCHQEPRIEFMSIFSTMPGTSLEPNKHQRLLLMKQNRTQLPSYTEIQNDEYSTQLSNHCFSCYVFSDLPLHHWSPLVFFICDLSFPISKIGLVLFNSIPNKTVNTEKINFSVACRPLEERCFVKTQQHYFNI